MHDNIDLIMRRANMMMTDIYRDEHTTQIQRTEIAKAYAQLNEGQSIVGVRITKTLKPDHGGDETTHAVRLIAHAMGLQLLENGALDVLGEAGPGHLVFLRVRLPDVIEAGLSQAQDTVRVAMAKGAALVVRFVCVPEEATPNNKSSAQGNFFDTPMNRTLKSRRRS